MCAPNSFSKNRPYSGSIYECEASVKLILIRRGRDIWKRIGMRGQVLTARKLLLLSVLVLGASPVAAEETTTPDSQPSVIEAEGSATTVPRKTLSDPNGPASAMPPRTSAAPAKSRETVRSESAVSKSNKASREHTAESIIQISPPAPIPPPPVEPVSISFHALATEGGPRLRSGLIWRIFSAKAEADGGFELISTHREAAPSTTLLPGEYLVNAAYGLSNLTKKIKVDGAEMDDETFVLNTGGLKLKAVLADGTECPDAEVEFDIESDERDQFGKRETILADAKPNKVVRLNAGAYHIRSLYGDANANVGVDVTVEPGRITQATIKHTGAKITFRLVQRRGGEALAGTEWQILTSTGDTVKKNVGALPTHILAAGSYAVIARHGGKSYSRKFAIEPGNDKQIEVAIADGPTPPKELQVLLEPPPPPLPGGSGFAGQSPSGAFGAAKPADPNAPLLNPGALLRPSR